MDTFTCILVYHGKVHVSQVSAKAPAQVPSRWADVYESRAIPFVEPDDRAAIVREVRMEPGVGQSVPEVGFREMQGVWQRFASVNDEALRLVYVKTVA